MADYQDERDWTGLAVHHALKSVEEMTFALRPAGSPLDHRLQAADGHLVDARRWLQKVSNQRTGDGDD